MWTLDFICWSICGIITSPFWRSVIKRHLNTQTGSTCETEFLQWSSWSCRASGSQQILLQHGQKSSCFADFSRLLYWLLEDTNQLFPFFVPAAWPQAKWSTTWFKFVTCTDLWLFSGTAEYFQYGSNPTDLLSNGCKPGVLNVMQMACSCRFWFWSKKSLSKWETIDEVLQGVVMFRCKGMQMQRMSY
jgi:hypothetical protein